MSKINAAIGNKSIEGIVKAREVARTIEKECSRYKISKDRAVGVTMNEIALIEYYEQKLTAKKLDDYNIKQSRERLIETCMDQGSKIVDLKHEINLIVNFVDTVNLVSVTKRNDESLYTLHKLLMDDMMIAQKCVNKQQRFTLITKRRPNETLGHEKRTRQKSRFVTLGTLLLVTRFG